MNKITAALLSTCFLFAAGSSFAENEYERQMNTTAKDHMVKDAMAKDHMAKDAMAKDHMAKDAMAKDHMGKDAMAKDHMAKDGMEKGSSKY